MSQAYLWYVRTGAGVIEVNRLTLLVVFVPVGETLRLERKGTHLGFLHATSPSLHLSACKNMRWDKDLKVVSFLVPFLPRHRVFVSLWLAQVHTLNGAIGVCQQWKHFPGTFFSVRAARHMFELSGFWLDC